MKQEKKSETKRPDAIPAFCNCLSVLFIKSWPFCAKGRSFGQKMLTQLVQVKIKELFGKKKCKFQAQKNKYVNPNRLPIRILPCLAEKHYIDITSSFN